MPVEPERPVKDADQERAVPLVWRPVLRQVVEAIRGGDPRRAGDLPAVAPVPDDVAEQIVAYLADDGERLVALPDATWATSVVRWTGDHWEVLVDLWTEEGRSDLVLYLQVVDSDSGYRFEVGPVYVP